MSTLEKPFVSACLAGSLSQKLIWWAALGHRVFSLVGGNNTHSLPPVLGCQSSQARVTSSTAWVMAWPMSQAAFLMMPNGYPINV